MSHAALAHAPEKNSRLRIRLICALTGAWGVATGYALFILISQRAEETSGSTAFFHFFAVLTVAVIVVSLTEWFRDTIRGEESQASTRRSLSAVLNSVLLLAVFEVCVLAYEEVSQATFESPYAVKELTASVSGKQNPYAFFRPDDILNPSALLQQWQTGFLDTTTPIPPPATYIAYSLDPEFRWTFFPDYAPRPSWHNDLANRISQYDPLLAVYPSSPHAGQPMPVSDLSPKQSNDLAALRRKLYILSNHDDIRLQSNSSFADKGLDPRADFYYDFHPGERPCDPSDIRCEPPPSAGIGPLSNATARNLSQTRLRNLITVELNNLILSPRFYDEDVFRHTDVPEGVRFLLSRERSDSIRFDDLQETYDRTKAEPPSQSREDRRAKLNEEMAQIAPRLLPVPRVVQLNRQLVFAAFPHLFAPLPQRFDERSANLIVLGLLWMCAGAALGWILSGAVFDSSGPGQHPSRRGALRGLAASLLAAPALVVLYVVVVRLASLARDAVHFRRELHYLWQSNTFPPDDLFDSSLLPLLLRLDSYWHHKWLTFSILLAATLFLAVYWFLLKPRHSERREESLLVPSVFPRNPLPLRIVAFFASLFALVLVALVFDANLPYVYLLVALVWITPAVFLGICGPKLRTGSPMPQAWGIIAVAAGLALVLLTILRLKWDTLSLWLLLPGIVLVATGLIMRAGLRLEEYWPLGALALGLAVCGISALVQQATFLGVLSDVHELNAYAGYGVKLAPPLQLLGSPAPPSNATQEPSPYDDYFETPAPPPTREQQLHQNLKDRIDTLRRQAQGRVSTGDLALDEHVLELQRKDQERLSDVRSEITRRLELSIVGSLGFWLTVGLLAAWSLRRESIPA